MFNQTSHMRLFFLIASLLVFIAPGSACAAVTVQQALSFGSFIMRANDAQYDITVNADGSYSYDAAGYIEITPPDRGVYLFDSLPVSTAITSVDVTQNTALVAVGGVFQMVNFQETHPATTSPLGEAQIFIGATARSNGGGSVYPDRTYIGTVDITINF